MHRRHHSVTVMQAAEDSPTLAQLTRLARESADRLDIVKALIPPSLHAAIQAGPIEGDSWCLLVKGNSAAAKLRQLLPALQSNLQAKGREVSAIRIKIQAGQIKSRP